MAYRLSVKMTEEYSVDLVDIEETYTILHQRLDYKIKENVIRHQRSNLLGWYRQNRRKLPWRGDKTGFNVDTDLPVEL